MTIQGAIDELMHLLDADDVPIYYKPSIEKVIDTIILERARHTADRKTEPQTIRCPKCGRSDYIREFGKDFSVTAEEAGFKYKFNTYIEPQTEREGE